MSGTRLYRVVGIGSCVLLSRIVFAQAPTVAVDLEVTQGMQYVNHPTHGTNSIPLVAGRLTAVRCQVSITGAATGTRIKKVTANLEVTKVGGSPLPLLTPSVSGPLNKSRFRKKLKEMLAGTTTFMRENADHTLNFEVDDLRAGTWKFVAKFDVKLGDNSRIQIQGSAILDVVKTRPIAIRLVPIRFNAANGEVFGPPDKTHLRDAEWLVRGCYPFPDATDIQWEGPQDLPTQDRPCVRMIDDQKLAGTSDVEEVLEALTNMWTTTMSSGFVPPDLFYYGFVTPATTPVFHLLIADGSCMPIYGWGLCPVGFGTASWDMAAKVFAHELGHAFGLEHCGPCGTGSCDLDSQVGWDVYAGFGWAAPQADRVSFMTCGTPAKRVWITPENYKKCIEVMTEGPTVGTLAGCGRVTDPPVSRALVVQGSLSDDGQTVARIAPIFRYPWGIAPQPAAAKGAYEIEAASEDRSVVVTRRFEGTLRVEDNQGEVTTKYGFFSVVIPFPPNTEVHSVAIKKGGRVLRAVTRTPGIPEIQIVSPGRGAVVNKPISVRWTVEDSDSDRASLRFHVLYSPDGGESFEPVAVNLLAEKANFDPSYVSASQNGLIRVMVSDGLNTSFRDVGLLKVTP